MGYPVETTSGQSTCGFAHNSLGPTDTGGEATTTYPLGSKLPPGLLNTLRSDSGGAEGGHIVFGVNAGSLNTGTGAIDFTASKLGLSLRYHRDSVQDSEAMEVDVLDTKGAFDDWLKLCDQRDLEQRKKTIDETSELIDNDGLLARTAEHELGVPEDEITDLSCDGREVESRRWKEEVKLRVEVLKFLVDNFVKIEQDGLITIAEMIHDQAIELNNKIETFDYYKLERKACREVEKLFNDLNSLHSRFFDKIDPIQQDLTPGQFQTCDNALISLALITYFH